MRSRVVWHYQRNVTDLGQHRMCAVNGALLRSSRMSVYVRDYFETSVATEFPKFAVRVTWEQNCTAVQRFRRDVVVIHGIEDHSVRVRHPSKQERTALAMAVASTTQLGENPPPNRVRASNPVASR